MRTYPTDTCNKNVPKGVFLVAETKRMNDEITETYYITKEGNICKVTDWVWDKPQPAYMNELCRLTLDTPNDIESMWKSFYLQNS
jgi:spore coat polysaccharide biosynthesis protein SpsF (cytidylyltransferase family)